MKKLMVLIALVGSSFAINAQSIARWKITDVVNYYSKPGDSVFVINFWATFCKPCVAEIPAMISISNQYAGRNVKMVLVSLDLASFYPGKIKQFAAKNNFDANIVWLDETDADYFCNVVDKKWSGSIPATLLVNNARNYRKFIEASMSAETFEKELKLALGE